MSLRRPASLPMYDADRAAVRAWWRGLAAALRRRGVAAVADEPEWPSDLNAHWRDPRLLLSQTCGYPLVTQLVEAVQVVGAFRYAVPGCRGIDYRSDVVVRRDEPADRLEALRGRTVAFNDRQSHSGHNALLARVAPWADGGRFFGRAIESGSHRASLALVASGRADVAAVDCVSLAAMGRATPQALHGLRVLGHTEGAPGLPLITARDTPPGELQALRDALAVACRDPVLAEVRAALFIDGFEAVDSSPWQVIDDLRRRAAEHGCVAL